MFIPPLLSWDSGDSGVSPVVVTAARRNLSFFYCIHACFDSHQLNVYIIWHFFSTGSTLRQEYHTRVVYGPCQPDRAKLDKLHFGTGVYEVVADRDECNTNEMKRKKRFRRGVVFDNYYTTANFFLDFSCFHIYIFLNLIL
jgi:hypothetical protein